MKRALIALAFTCAAVFGSACNKVTYKNPGVMPTGQVYNERGWFFIFGVAGEKVFPVYQMCPNGVSQIQSKNSFVDLLIGAITFGIISPRSYEIQCGGAR